MDLRLKKGAHAWGAASECSQISVAPMSNHTRSYAHRTLAPVKPGTEHGHFFCEKSIVWA